MDYLPTICNFHDFATKRKVVWANVVSIETNSKLHRKDMLSLCYHVSPREHTIKVTRSTAYTVTYANQMISTSMARHTYSCQHRSLRRGLEADNGCRSCLTGRPKCRRQSSCHISRSDPKFFCREMTGGFHLLLKGPSHHRF